MPPLIFAKNGQPHEGRKERNMKLINALNELKELGIQTVTSGSRVHSIDAYISNAEEVLSENNVDDDSRLLAMPDGNYIVTDKTLGFETVLCSTYATEDEAGTAFEAYQIAEQAEAIADEMEAKRPGELPRAAWVMIATAELKSAYAAAKAAFEREFGGI